MKKFLEKLKEILLNLLNSNIFKRFISVMIDVLGVEALYNGTYKILHDNMNWTTLFWFFMAVSGFMIIKTNQINYKNIGIY